MLLVDLLLIHGSFTKDMPNADKKNNCMGLRRKKKKNEKSETHNNKGPVQTQSSQLRQD